MIVPNLTVAEKKADLDLQAEDLLTRLVRDFESAVDATTESRAASER